MAKFREFFGAAIREYGPGLRDAAVEECAEALATVDGELRKPKRIIRHAKRAGIGFVGGLLESILTPEKKP